MVVNPIVIALGGNALKATDAPVDRQKLATACAALARQQQRAMVVTHGNGAQVGEWLSQDFGGTSQPLDMLDAGTEGMLGYRIEQELANQAHSSRIVTVLTRVTTHADDPALQHPTKPIGREFDRRDYERLQSQHPHWHFMRNGDRYRRLVASPKPQQVLQLDAVRLLLDEGYTVICAGGGGIPVVASADGRLHGVDAVIDKDYTSALIAARLCASLLVLATDVDGIYLDWESPQRRKLSVATPDMIADIELPAGSMGAKVDAACQFVTSTGASAVIGAVDDLPKLLALQAGTRICMQLGASDR